MSDKILVVDDDILVLEALHDLLKSAGYEVKVASRGQEAMEILNKEHFDLLILDLVMPKMTGFDLCREIRKRDDEKSKIKIIILTAKTSEQTDNIEEKYGCNLYLNKPIDPEKLKEFIRCVLENSEQKKMAIMKNLSEIK